MKRRLAMPLVVLLLGCGGATGDVDERIAVLPGGTLEVDLDLGDGLRPDRGGLEVHSHDADEVWILAESSGWGSYGVRFRLDHEEGRVRLVGRVGGTTTWLFGGPRIDVRIWVPRRFDADLRTTAGPIRVEDLEGRVRARALDGGLEASGIEGPLKLRTSSGDLRISEVSGPVDARTGSGSIRVRAVAGDLDVRTRRGDVEIERIGGRLDVQTDRGSIDLLDLSGPVQAKTERGAVFASFLGDPTGSLETRRGSVEVALPLGAAARIEARTPRGDLEVASVFAAAPAQSGEAATVRLNGGRAPLHLYSARGSVRVRQR